MDITRLLLAETQGPICAALENFSQGIGLIPEQIWDGPDLAARHLRFGGATNAAVPLLWAHSEYVKLHRSAADGRVFDLVEPAYERYVWRTGEHKNIEVWKLNRQVQTVPAGTLLWIQASSPFLLHWTGDEWQHSTDTRSQPTALDIDFVDIRVTQQLQAPIRFTFLWLEENRWEGKDYEVEVHASKVEIEQSNDMLRKSEAHGKRTSTVA